MIKATSKGPVEMNADEIAALEQRKAEYARALPFNTWLVDMAAMDAVMPRSLEDTMDAVGTENFPQIVQERYAQRKALRAQKPE